MVRVEIRLDRKGRALIKSTEPQQVEPRLGKYRILLLAGLGGILENYDFTVFALFARPLGQLFFPPGIPEWLAVVQTLGIFAAGNLARPFGGLILAHYGDLLGRKRTFIFSMLLMALATLGMAFAPTYASVGGAAPIMLLMLRILQGAAIGGELPGAWTFVAEQVAANRVSFGCGVLMSALSIGNLLAALTGIVVNRLYQPAGILAFGWRIPFLAGGIVALFSVYVRRWLVETPVFRDLQRRGELAIELPLKLVLRNCGRGILASVALTSMIAVTIVVVLIITPTLLQTTYGIDVSKSFEAVSLATACLSLSCVGCGILADRLGAHLFLVLGAPILAASVYMLFALLPAHSDRVFLLYSLTGVSAGVVAGIPSMLVESFPPAIRFTGMAFSYNVAFAVVSGVTPPLIVLALRVDPLAHAHAVLLACAAAFLVALARLLSSRIYLQSS